MNKHSLSYQSIVGQINYFLFLIVVALLPFPQIFLRYACVVWLFSWLLEGRFLQKPKKEHLHKMIPFLLFGGWYLWKVISGLWAENTDAYLWQLERYMVFGLMIPVGIWGLNNYYDWKEICRVLVISCVAAAGVYVFTLYWVYNHHFFDFPIHRHHLESMSFEFFEGKISYIKHRLYLCSTEMMGIMAMFYIRKDVCYRYGTFRGWMMTVIAVLIMSGLILATGSRASIISGFTLIAIGILYQLPKRHIRYNIAITLFAVFVGLGVLTLHPRMQNFQFEQVLSPHIDKENDIRLNIWAIAISQPEDYSLYGLGAGQSVPYLQKLYQQFGFEDYARIGYAAHNQYLAEWIEIGVPGLLFFLLAWLSIVYYTHGRARKSAVIFFALFILNMFTDCMWGKFDGIALWLAWMVFIRIQTDTQTHQEPSRNT